MILLLLLLLHWEQVAILLLNTTNKAKQAGLLFLTLLSSWKQVPWLDLTLLGRRRVASAGWRWPGYMAFWVRFPRFEKIQFTSALRAFSSILQQSWNVKQREKMTVQIAIKVVSSVKGAADVGCMFMRIEVFFLYTFARSISIFNSHLLTLGYWIIND